MNTISKLVSWVGLAATVVPCLLYYVEIIDLDAVKLITLIGTIIWFIATPLWMGRESVATANEGESR